MYIHSSFSYYLEFPLWLSYEVVAVFLNVVLEAQNIVDNLKKKSKSLLIFLSEKIDENWIESSSSFP